MVRQTPDAIARALEFAILTASREGMVRGLAWEEIKWKSGTWEIPGPRMKSDRAHRIALSQCALAIADDEGRQGKPNWAHLSWPR
jgi:integrase